MPVWRDPRGYLGAGVAGVVLVLLGQFLIPSWSLGTVYVVDVVAIGTIVAMIALWLTARSTADTGRWQVLFLAATFGAWAAVTVLAISRFSVMQPAVLITGLLLGLALVKPPTAGQAAWVLDVLGWSLVVVIVVTLGLEATGTVPSWYDRWWATDLMLAEREQYWLPLAGVLGLDARWAGPFVHPGRVGEVAALLVAWGVTRVGTTRVVVTAGGLLALLLAGSRTSYLAAAAGVLAVVIIRGWPSLARPVRWAVVALGLGGLVATLVLIVGTNPGLTGRTSVWPTYYRLWQGDPLWGVGGAGVAQAQAQGLLPTWAYHAHSLWLDVLARHGLVVLVLVVAALASAVALAVGSARHGRGATAGVVVVLLVSSITHSLVDWSVPDVPMLFLVLAVLSTESHRQVETRAPSAVAS